MVCADAGALAGSLPRGVPTVDIHAGGATSRPGAGGPPRGRRLHRLHHRLHRPAQGGAGGPSGAVELPGLGPGAHRLRARRRHPLLRQPGLRPRRDLPVAAADGRRGGAAGSRQLGPPPVAGPPGAPLRLYQDHPLPRATVRADRPPRLPPGDPNGHVRRGEARRRPGDQPGRAARGRPPAQPLRAHRGHRGCTAYRFERADVTGEGALPIGTPVWNSRAYVVDEDLRPLPPGEEGELVLGGACVAEGYLGGGEPTTGRASSTRWR